jgi:ferric-dicitrate binding protein FerR (iron transport regulator)
MFVRQFLASVLILVLAVPAWSVPTVVGTTAASQSATVRGSALLPGSTIFSGDTIQVGTKGMASIALTGGVQVRVGPESQVRFAREKETAQLEIGRGSASFRVAPGVPFEARLADATIRGAGSGPAVGVILVQSEEKAVIAAEKGELVVSTAHDSRSMTLREGEGVEVTLAPEPQGTSGTSAKTLSGKRVAILALVSIGIVAAIAIWRGTTEISDEEKRNEVSPFRFP